MVKRGTGFWVLICIGILLTIEFLLGQTMAFIHYDFTVAAGLQESADEITETGVALNKGFGLGDTLVYIPLFIVGIIGVFRTKFWGLVTLFGALAITAYWPVVALSTLYFAKGTPGWKFNDYTSYTILLSLITFYGVWGMFYLYKTRRKYI